MTIAATKIKNDLLLKVLDGKEVPRPPVWMMRQAGRFLPDYRKLKEKYSFFERIRNADLATEITVMPVEQVGVDAAILFSDILIIPQALGIDVSIVPEKGPVIENPIRTVKDAFNLKVTDILNELSYTFEAVKVTKQALADEVPLIGFAGSPWTLLCYMVEGQGSKDFSKAKAFCFEQPEAAHHVLNVLTESIISFLKAKVASGVDTVQIFDSWGGLLSPQDYEEFSFPYIKRIVDTLATDTKVIVFPKGCWFTLDKWLTTQASAIGLDWTITPEYAREATGGSIALQGNLDPSILFGSHDFIKTRTLDMVKRFGTKNYIANLGHGILPNTPVDNARVFIDTIKSLGS